MRGKSATTFEINALANRLNQFLYCSFINVYDIHVLGDNNDAL